MAFRLFLSTPKPTASAAGSVAGAGVALGVSSRPPETSSCDFQPQHQEALGYKYLADWVDLSFAKESSSISKASKCNSTSDCSAGTKTTATQVHAEELSCLPPEPLPAGSDIADKELHPSTSAAADADSGADQSQLSSAALIPPPCPFEENVVSLALPTEWETSSAMKSLESLFQPGKSSLTGSWYDAAASMQASERALQRAHAVGVLEGISQVSALDGAGPDCLPPAPPSLPGIYPSSFGSTAAPPELLSLGSAPSGLSTLTYSSRNVVLDAIQKHPEELHGMLREEPIWSAIISSKHMQNILAKENAAIVSVPSRPIPARPAGADPDSIEASACKSREDETGWSFLGAVLAAAQELFLSLSRRLWQQDVPPQVPASSKQQRQPALLSEEQLMVLGNYMVAVVAVAFMILANRANVLAAQP